MRLPVLRRRTTLRGRDSRVDRRQLLAFRTTLFDYGNPAPACLAPRSLSANNMHAFTANVLNITDIVGNNFIADRNPLPKVKV
jgi:hypothetical protein